MEASALHPPAGLSRIAVAAPLLRLRSDEQLVALFRAGSDEAFRTIHDRYRQRLLAYTRQMLAGSRSDAEDALQDVFLRAYHALRADGRPITLRAWLYRVAHNRCIDQLRRPVPSPADIFDLNRTPLGDPLDEAQRRESLRRLVADIRGLPPQQRSALLMREMEGLSLAELAAALDVSVPAVKSLLVRARIGLVDAVEARDADCTQIRSDLDAARGRGVRVSGRARRHLRDCNGCREYRTSLRTVREGLAALSPGPGPLATVLGLLGLGGASGGAAATSAGGAGIAVGGGAVAGGTAAKVVAVVGCVAVVGGGAAEVERIASSPPAQRAPAAAKPATAPTAPPASARPDPAVTRRGPRPAKRAPERRVPAAPAEQISVRHPAVPPAAAAIGPGGSAEAASELESASGGVMAPDVTAEGAAPAEPAAADSPTAAPAQSASAAQDASEPAAPPPGR